MQTIQFEARDAKVKANKVRKAGKVPAVFYGPKESSTPIAVSEQEFKKTWKEAGESSIVVLKGANGDEHEVLIQDVDLHPVTGMPLHADFYVIEKGKKLKLNIPLEFVGIAPAVKDLGGTLVKVLHEVEIEALPKDLPHDIKVDISSLTALDSQILAKDLELPQGVTLETKPEEVVAAISVAVEEPEEAPAADLSSIEVVGDKEKAEKAAAEAAEGEADKK